MAQPTDRLLTQLNQTQLQQKDNPLYQVIKQLIGIIKDLSNAVNGASGGGGGGTTNNFISNIQQFLDLGIGFDGVEESMVIPGPAGANGTSGSGTDYVVASDGVPVSPSPINDGAGNFIYIPYIP